MPLGGSFVSPMPARPQLTQGRPVVTDTQDSFAGGLNTVSAEDALAPNQFRRGDNGRLTSFGAFTKRGGTQRTAAALAAFTVQHGFTWLQSGGTAVPMAIVNGGLYTTSYGSFPLTWTNRAGALSTTITPSFAQFLNAGGVESVYIADGGLLNRYTGTTLTVNIASTPSVKQVEVFNERLWGSGDTSTPDSIYYSALNNGDTLGIGASAGGQIVVRTFGKQDVIGIKSVGTSLMIFHRQGVSRLTGYGQSDITVAPAAISGDVGCLAPFSLVRVDNIVYFISERGLYQASEQGVIPVNDPATPDPLSVILPLMSATNIANIRAVFNRGTREILIQIPGYGIYVFHTILRAWAGPWVDGYQSPETSALFEAVNSSNYPIILRGDASGFISECDRPAVYLDNVAAAGTGGTSYASALQPRRFYCDTPHVAKAWRYAYLLASLSGSDQSSVAWTTDSASDTETLPVSMASTWGSSGSTWGSGGSVWGAPAQTSYRVDIDGHGYFIDILISDSGEALPVYSKCAVQGYALGRR